MTDVRFRGYGFLFAYMHVDASQIHPFRNRPPKLSDSRTLLIMVPGILILALLAIPLAFRFFGGGHARDLTIAPALHVATTSVPAKTAAPNAGRRFRLGRVGRRAARRVRLAGDFNAMAMGGRVKLQREAACRCLLLVAHLREKLILAIFVQIRLGQEEREAARFS